MPEQPPAARPPQRKLLLYAALLACALAALAWYGRPDGALKIVFLETQGDAVLIQTPAGGYVLVDGGADPAALAAALGKHMPFWRHTLEAVVLTGTDAARLPGQVAALARYHANLAIVAPALKPNAALAEWQRLAQAGKTRIHIARAGERINLGGALLRVLALGGEKEAGMLLRIEYGATSAVLDQSGLLGAAPPQPADLLAFPWEHDPRTPPVVALHPRAIVFTDGQQAAQPAELTFRERAVGGAQLYHERLNGAITWASDGRRAWLTTER